MLIVLIDAIVTDGQNMQEENTNASYAHHHGRPACIEMRTHCIGVWRTEEMSISVSRQVMNTWSTGRRSAYEDCREYIGVDEQNGTSFCVDGHCGY